MNEKLLDDKSIKYFEEFTNFLNNQSDEAFRSLTENELLITKTINAELVALSDEQKKELMDDKYLLVELSQKSSQLWETSASIEDFYDNLEIPLDDGSTFMFVSYPNEQIEIYFTNETADKE